MIPRKTTPTATTIWQTPRGKHKLRPRIIALGLSFIAGLMAVFVTEANAVVCPPPTGYKSIGGTCYKVKGVEINAEVNHTGHVQRHPKSFHGEIFTGVEGGVLFCGNKGGNQPPGQRIVPVDTPLTCSHSIEPQDVVSSRNGGTAHVRCTALLPSDVLQALGDQYCIPGQEAFDFVPCAFLSDVTYVDDETSTVIETARHSCFLPDCPSLRWNNKAGRPEPRDYECEGPID
jgi:hypothetical protein